MVYQRQCNTSLCPVLLDGLPVVVLLVVISASTMMRHVDAIGAWEVFAVPLFVPVHEAAVKGKDCHCWNSLMLVRSPS